MHSRMVPCVIAFALLGVATLGAAPRSFAVRGDVRAPLTNGHVVVRHEEIVGFMPAMTMSFAVAPSAVPAAAGLRTGDQVEFALHVDEEHSFADGFRVIGQAGAPVPVRSPATPAVVRLHVGDLMPDFALVDELGQPVTRTALHGQATVVTFIFTRCPVPEFCPLVVRRFGELQKAILADAELARRARLLGVTLDPEFDRPDVLKAYGAAVGANPAVWRFATGAPADVGALIKAFSVYTERNGVSLDHTLCTALIDGDGRVVELWRGNGWKVDEVLEAVRRTP